MKLGVKIKVYMNYFNFSPRNNLHLQAFQWYIKKFSGM